MVPRSLVLVTLVGLFGCSEGPPAPGAAPAPAPAQPVPVSLAGPALPAQPTVASPVAGVRAGQRYHFRLDQAGTQVDMVWEVTAVSPAEVRYEVSVLKNGVGLGPPGETVWPVPSPPTEEEGEPAPPVKGDSYEDLELAGRTWRCRVTEVEGTRTWIAQAGPVDAFPPLLKQTKDGRVTSVLTRIEEGRR